MNRAHRKIKAEKSRSWEFESFEEAVVGPVKA